MKKTILLIASIAGLAPIAPSLRADDPVVPGAGYPASRYEVLWTKSPFAVATAEAAPESVNYTLYGYYTDKGISYASLVEKQNNEHFLISTDKDKAVRGMTLTSITHSPDGSDTYALVQKDGQPITLKLESAPTTAPAPGGGMAGMNPQNIPPGTPLNFPGSTRPFPRFHRPPVSPPVYQVDLQKAMQIHTQAESPK